MGWWNRFSNWSAQHAMQRMLRLEEAAYKALAEGKVNPRAGVPEVQGPLEGDVRVARVRLVRGEPFRFTHLSDLHFGRENLGKRTALRQQVDRFNPHLVIVTGDIVDTPSAPFFDEARRFLDGIGDGREILVVAGNHDRH